MAVVVNVKNPPVTTTVTSHGLQVVARGKIIGEIQDWTPAAMVRAMKWVYELNMLTSGTPVDVIPGNISGYTVVIKRYDILHAKYEEVFGDLSWEVALGNQQEPFDVKQYLTYSDGSKELIVYRGCWMSSVGRKYSAEGDRIVVVDATLTYLKAERVLAA